MSWNTVLQMNHPNGGGSISLCRMETVPGLGLPIHIHLLSCQMTMEQRTIDIFRSVAVQLGLPSSFNACGGPLASGTWDSGMMCMAWGELACRHVLVLLTDGSTLDPQTERLAQDWKQRAGGNGVIIPVLSLGAGSASLPNSLRGMNRLSDLGSADALAADILRWIHLGAERKIFLSYRRDDTKDLADQIHQALVQRGYRIYLDRFSGTPGRFFPQEIAEELADKGCVLLLESRNLAQSRWTKWEIAFARHYRLGLMALNVDGAPPLSGPQPLDRMNVRTKFSSGDLSSSDLDNAVGFVAQRYSINAIARRVYYEELLRRTANAEGVGFQELGAGTYELSARGKTALVYPSGRPGSLAELHHAAVFPSTAGSSDFRILAGQHQHLPSNTSRDLDWLARLADVRLRQSSQLPKSIRDFAYGGSP